MSQLWSFRSAPPIVQWRGPHPQAPSPSITGVSTRRTSTRISSRSSPPRGGLFPCANSLQNTEIHDEKPRPHDHQVGRERKRHARVKVMASPLVRVSCVCFVLSDPISWIPHLVPGNSIVVNQYDFGNLFAVQHCMVSYTGCQYTIFDVLSIGATKA